ncbi:unnamed protein product [Heterobilharzia americana]|nr:unnamed protein product [Heterobilharzia americana]
MSSKCKYESNTAIEEEAANTITSTCGLCDHNDIINCNEAVGSSCNTSSSLITADSSSKTDVKHSENRDHISMRYKYALNGNTMVNSDYCKPTNTTTTTTTTTSTNISTIFTTSSSCITKTSTILTPTNTSTSVIDSGHTSSGVNTLSSYSSSYPPATFPSHRRRRGGGINGAMHATSGGANNNNNNNNNNSNNNNKNYSSFRSHNRPANFGFNKSLQNSVWNHHQSATSVASKSHSDYHHHHHHDGLQNSINNNQTSHYQQHHPSPVYYQPHPHYHRGSISGATGGGGGPTQDLDMDSEMENEKACATDMSTCSLPVNVLLPTVQSPSSYCSQSDRLLNSQCYSHHHHHQVHQHLQPYDAYMNKGFGSNTNGAMSVGNDTIITNEHEDIDLTTTNVGWSTQDRIIHNLLSNILSPQVTEVKSHSALIQLSFPQDLIHSSIVTPETETSLLTTTTTTDINCTSITTLVTGTLPLITATTTTTTKAKSIPTLSSDNGLSSLTESNSNNDTVNSYKATYSPSKNLHNEYKPSSSSSLTTTTPIATTALSTTKRNLSKGDISNHSATNNDNNSNNNENDEYGSANDELNANSNITTSNTDTNNDNINQNEQYQLTIDLDAIQFELHLTERCSTPQFKCVFIGEATFISLQDLRPGTNYYVKVCCNYSGIRGDFSPVAHFITLPSQPSPPRTIQIICQTRNSLHIKWGPGIDNGSRITSYKLEYAQVSTNSSEIGLDKNQDPEFFEPIQVFGRSYKINQLSPSTEYLIRVAAINQYGQSSWSPILSASTSGSPPDMPLPPFLIQADVHSLTLGWRPPTNLSDQYQYHNHHHHDITCDQTNSSSYMNHLNPITYTLEMDDQAMGHGFVTVFDGTGTEHCIDNLRRNTRYRFRLAASNVDGRSRWSETITLTTLPDHPSPPRNLRIYGSLLQPTRLAITWDVPEDDGGMPIQAYRLEALLPYSNSNNNNTSLVNGTLTNGSNTKLNDGTYSLEKIDDHMDVIKKLICWPHVTALKPGAPILSAINSSCSPNIISANTSSSSAAITTTTANVVDENYLVNNYDSNHKITSDMTNGNRKYQSRIFEMDSNVIDCTKSTENAQNNNNDNNGTTTSITTISPTITTSTAHNTDYDLELNYSHTAWFIIYEGPEKELLIENLPPGFCLQLRVRASCSLTDNTNPLCSAFSSTSSSSSSSSSVSSGRVSVLNLHNYSTDMSYSLARSKTVGMNAAVTTTTTTTATANTSATTTSVGGGTTGSGGLWGMANCPPLKIRMPPIPPSAPCSGPRLVGKPKPTSLHLCWSPPKQTGGAPILAYEVWQLTLELQVGLMKNQKIIKVQIFQYKDIALLHHRLH